MACFIKLNLDDITDILTESQVLREIIDKHFSRLNRQEFAASYQTS